MITEVAAADPAGVAAAVAALRRGELVGLPTETVYGLAASLAHPDAIAAVFAVKARPAHDPLIVHVAAEAGDASVDALIAAGLVASALTPAQRHTAALLLAVGWPGPLTLVLPRGEAIPDAVTSGLPLVALRAPAHPTARAVIAAAGPVVAPSANRFGRISPTTAQAVVDELGGRIPLVLDGGPCTTGVESTVVRVEPDGGITLLRPGAVTATQLAAWTARDVVRVAGTASEGSPGRLASHYAPRTPLVLVDPEPPGPWWEALDLRRDGGAVAYLAWTRPSERVRDAVARRGAGDRLWVLSADGSLQEAARALYGCLRAADAAGVALIAAERPPGVGVGEALRDRLERAAAGTPPLA